MLDGVSKDGVEQDLFGLAGDPVAPSAPAKAKGTKRRKAAEPVAEDAGAEAPVAGGPALEAAAVPDGSAGTTAPVAGLSETAPTGFDLARALRRLGWDASLASVRDLAAPAHRGTSLALAAPHAPAHAGPVVAGLVARLAAEPGTRALLLCPAGEETVWAALAATAAAGSSVRTAAALGAARAQRRLREGDLDLLITSPDTALLLHRRAALKPESFTSVLLAWPRLLETSSEALELLMADLPKDATRLVVTDDAIGGLDFVERYARKAARIGFPSADADATVPPKSGARTVAVAWERRASAVADILELLDPSVATVWSADRQLDGELAQVLPTGDVRLGRAVGAEPVRGTVICTDLPTAEQLAAFAAQGDVVLLVPPTADVAAGRLLHTRRPLRLPSALEQATTHAATQRAAIAKSLESGDPTAALLTLAPLFERHDPTLVAAGLYRLWTEAMAASTAAATAAAVATPVPDAPATAKVFVGIGKKDNATVADLVAVLTKELKVEKAKIGRIELRDAFMLVELPALEAEQIAKGLNGAQIRRKRITARIDRGLPPRSDRGPRTDRGSRPERRG